MGIFIGGGLGNIVGGVVVQSVSGWPALAVPVLGTIASWRLTFLMVGIPGILIAILACTLREPVRRSLLRSADGNISKLSLREVIEQVRRRWQSVIGISIGTACQAGSSFALVAWVPEPKLRSAIVIKTMN